jgi:peptidoglycan/LPS O-acetylase OafA/YrhL
VRAVAITAVLLVHGGVPWAGGGFLGVDVFFVLSGYLITSLLCRDFGQHHTIRLARFWAQRARRLLPALAVTLLGIAVYAWMFASSTDLAALRADVVSTVLYVANWHFIITSQNYFTATQPSPLLHTWSLAVEEQYYLIWPLVALFVLRRRGPRGLAMVAGVGALASAVLTATLHGAGASVDRLYYGTDTRAQALLVGSCLGASGIAPLRVPAMATLRSSVSGRRAAAWPAGAAGLIGAAVLLACFHDLGGGPSILFVGGFLVVALAAAALIASVVRLPRSALARALSLGPVVFVGRISYGIYLYHWPLFMALDSARTGLSGLPLLALRLGATLAVATLSWVLLEEPVRTHRVFARHRATWALGGAAILLVPTLAVSTATTAAAPVQVPHGQPPPSQRAQLAAVHAFTTDPVRFVVFGDSIGLTLGIGLSYEAPPRYGVLVRNQAERGCDLDPGLEQRVNGVPAPVESGCPSWRTAWPATARALHAEVVGLVLGRWEEVDHRYQGQWTHVGERLWDHHLENELGQAVTSLAATGARVALFTLPDVDPAAAAPDGAAFPENAPSRAAAYNADLRVVAGRFPGQTTVVDLNRMLDPDGHYTTDIDGIVVRWPDGVHISIDGGVWLQSKILPTVAALGLEVRHAALTAAEGSGRR